jgi:excinuclease UvrABC ATPase subunit
VNNLKKVDVDIPLGCFVCVTGVSGSGKSSLVNGVIDPVLLTKLNGARRKAGKHISVDIFSDEYMDKINAIHLPNTKIKILQRLLAQAIEEYRKVNKIMSLEFAERMKRVVDEYNNRRRDEAFANEVLDDEI